MLGNCELYIKSASDFRRSSGSAQDFAENYQVYPASQRPLANIETLVRAKKSQPCTYDSKGCGWVFLSHQARKSVAFALEQLCNETISVVKNLRRCNRFFYTEGVTDTTTITSAPNLRTPNQREVALLYLLDCSLASVGANAVDGSASDL